VQGKKGKGEGGVGSLELVGISAGEGAARRGGTRLGGDSWGVGELGGSGNQTQECSDPESEGGGHVLECAAQEAVRLSLALN